jgi:alkanesulfonate monooxygenase SsuD/methylene tetrahydromethanopterin reductase-like flavin-dependent oxidoreductase (luciferase family)
MRWASTPLPVMLCAEGPKTQRLAGRFADGVLLYNGITREVVEASIAQVRAGAEAAGRRFEDVHLHWIAVFELCDDVAAGREAVKFSLAGTANRAFRYSLTDKLVPERLHAGFRGLQQEYQSSRHQQRGEHHHNAALLDKYGLTDYLIDRFAIIGPPEVCAERLRELASWGVRSISLSVLSRDLRGHMEMMRRTAEEVFPKVL